MKRHVVYRGAEAGRIFDIARQFALERRMRGYAEGLLSEIRLSGRTELPAAWPQPLEPGAFLSEGPDVLRAALMDHYERRGSSAAGNEGAWEPADSRGFAAYVEAGFEVGYDRMSSQVALTWDSPT